MRDYGFGMAECLRYYYEKSFTRGFFRPDLFSERGSYMKQMILSTVILLSTVFFLGLAQAGQDLSVGVYGGIITSAHSECDSTHCLDGLYLAGVSVDYDLFNSERFTFRTGLAYYNLTYEESYRATSKDPRQDTTQKTTDVFITYTKGGVLLFDGDVEVFGTLGYGTTLAYGYGIGYNITDNITLEVESINFDDNCDQFSTYVGGIRWSF